MKKTPLLEMKTSIKLILIHLTGKSCHSVCHLSDNRDSKREKRCKIAANHLLSRTDDTLESAFVIGSGSSVPDGDEGGEDGLDDAGVHCKKTAIVFTGGKTGS